MPRDDVDGRLLQRAIDAATASVAEGGGPFGAVVARGGEVLAVGTNRVTASGDPTAHAEMTAIRAACAAIGGFSLEGCDLYASAEPCPMCLGAVYWARLRSVVFAATRADAAAAGFDDESIYREIPKPAASREIPFRHVDTPDARRPFDAWRAFAGKTPY